MLCWSLEQDTIYSEFLSGFLSLFQIGAAMFPQLGHYCVLPNPFSSLFTSLTTIRYLHWCVSSVIKLSTLNIGLNLKYRCLLSGRRIQHLDVWDICAYRTCSTHGSSMWHALNIPHSMSFVFHYSPVIQPFDAIYVSLCRRDCRSWGYRSVGRNDLLFSAYRYGDVNVCSAAWNG